MKALVLAEKPSVAREIARVLKCNVKNKGFLEGPQFVVTWALGHLVTLAEPDDYDKKYKEWRLEDLPMLPANMKLKVIRQTSHQFQVVRNLMKREDLKELVIATDAGREGELVARWIMVLSDWKKPFKRLWISSQTDDAIREGFAGLKAGTAYNNLYDAAVCRAEADWLIGLNVTRALTCKFNAQLTAGRVQTPTLAMIVNREAEIKQFVPVDFWTIRADFGDYFGDWRNQAGNSRIFNYTQTEEIAAKLKGHQGVIKEVRTEGKSEPAPLAYDLTELQRDANKRYGFSAQKTLSILQDLYEQHKLVTYPRTDSRYITSDIVPTLPARLKSITVVPYAELVKPLLQKPLMPTKRFVDNNKVSDHHAIIPTEKPLQLTSLKTEERNLYDLIVRRFIAVLYPPYRYDQTTLITVINGENFYSRGKVVKDQGWRAVTSKSAEKDALNDDALPEQTLTLSKKGDPKQVKGCKINKSKTKPPARYTEATLLTAMESPGKFIEDEELREAMKGSGLGTPATRAEIIEKLLYNNYIERQGKELVPTSKGTQLIKLVAPALKTPELTAQWEQRLSNIARGKGSKTDFMADIRQNAMELVKSVIDDTAVYKADNISRTKCPVCGKFMLLVNGKRGKMLICQDRACGHRQPEKQDDFGYKSSKNAGRVNQKLIAQYSDQGSIGHNLGDLLKVALAKENTSGE
ncbi:DNA topoisomerase III [Peptococcaceae bacterium SCADC1_2_3]|nr:DNA topoisomerase III [Peptococcaceae bacterium SCADC1_2_3]KFI35686.1 DNA topoisomerase III [Peptococcaceae bacterium SCADC1_2_3]KFI36646.1 DNA topoisomerase III [Peptococcaceae bacterium SCADC1_2_3]KFI37417.1 DNA topoisomerase III [Peptococcaceae bacterium SCADC1_2_3]HBQ28629.1 DNA topoisomerase III [Desulfotomaculum sp.]